MNLKTKAETLLKLHSGGRILVLVNAWDVASGLIVEAAGAPAIATTSAGVANVLGYQDGQRISRAEMAAAGGRIARAVSVPVTVDAEAGYGPTPEDAAETARQLLAAGIVGMNFEDRDRDAANPLVALEQQVARIRAIRQVAAAADVPFVLNARTDVYLVGAGAPEARFDETVRRAKAYREAGADCIFVPGVTDAKTIGELVRAIPAPLNILATPGAPTVGELERLGVARVSTGSGFMRACYARTRDVARDILATGSWQSLFESAISYREMNEMLSAARRAAAPNTPGRQ
jgi:2-methylisocitrate lyase-like PEP mutase family enzyme